MTVGRRALACSPGVDDGATSTAGPRRRRGARPPVGRGLADVVFPQPGAGTAPLRSVALVVVVTLLSLARQTGTPAWASLWAEDGPVFLAPAAADGFWSTVTASYAGYLHLLPRVVAEGAVLVPLPWLPAVVAVTAALVAGVVAALVEVAARGHVRSTAVRVVLALLVVAHPVPGSETLNSIALAQWPLAFGACWVALWRPRSPAGRATAAVALAVAALSAPLALIVAPVLAVRLALVRGADRAVPSVGLAAMAVQAAALVVLPTQVADGGSGLGPALAVYAQRVVTSALLGYAANDVLWPVAGGALVAVVVLATAGLLGWGLVRADAPGRAAIAGFGLASVVAFVGSVVIRGVVAAMVWQPGVDGVVRSGARFAVVPILLLCSALAVVVDTVLRRGGRALPAVTVAVLLVVVGADLRIDNARTTARPWDEALAEARVACAALDAPAAVDVPLPPETVPFVLTLPCDGVAEDRLGAELRGERRPG